MCCVNRYQFSMAVCLHRHFHFALMALLIGLPGCGSTSNNGSSTGDEKDAGPQIELPVVPSPISCESACSRAAKCAEALVTKADCLALCMGDAKPETYACCIQYADGCAEVQSCVNGNFKVCKPSGDPWVPLEVFDECQCGEPGKDIPKNAECIKVDHDSPCVTGVCFKPVVSNKTPFCAIRCGAAYPTCPEGMKCQQTAKTDYCKFPFQD